jgi:intracellular multiplication protein IcmD
MTKAITQSNKLNPALSLLFYFGALFALFLISSVVFAGGGSSTGGQNLGSVASNITGTMNSVAQLITAVSYVAGVGFALMGMLKLKAHKDQPTQVPLSQPLVLLAIAAGLVFLPSLISSTGATVWGSSAENANTKGGGVLGTESGSGP